MNIQEMIDIIKDTSLAYDGIKSFYVGNVWDMSNTKGDIYPNVWVEFPVLVNYTIRNQKSYRFSIDILSIAKSDDSDDEMKVISQCEELIDGLLSELQAKFKMMSFTTVQGLTLRNVNNDLAVGIRVDVEITTKRLIGCV